MDLTMVSLQICIQLLFPVILGFLLVKRLALPARIFFVGILFFLVSQVMELPIVAGFLIFDLGLENNPLARSLLAGLTAGVFEESARYLGFRFNHTMRANRTWSAALLYGAGHGGAESILLGLGVVAITIVAMIAPEQLPAELVGGGEAVWYAYLLGGLERIFAITLHISLAVLVLQVFLQDSIIYLFLAMTYHALVNFIAVGIHAIYENLLLTEGVVLVFALISLGIIWYFRDTKPGPSSEPVLTG
ncbi:MAG: YhfC family glutamic-type intramembrane protease [Anaerolineales bacterium]|jgi:uncharacterized membrane protein YhfC